MPISLHFPASVRLLAMASLAIAPSARAVDYEKDILPILEDNCYNCHGDGAHKGKVSFDDSATTEELMGRTDLWVHALKNVRAGIMPPPKKKRLPAADLAMLVSWIKRDALRLDPARPDPGRVTLRRLNRVEYRNTIRDLMGIDFRTDEEFPADDSGYGFDNIGDVLTTSPMLLEKYMQAAETIVAQAVPLVPGITPQRQIAAGKFNGTHDGEIGISLYDAADLTAQVKIRQAGTYRIVLDATVRGSFTFDPGRADCAWSIDGKPVLHRELKWENGHRLDSSIEVKWAPGKHPLRLVLKPLEEISKKPADLGDGPPDVRLGFRGATIVGPLEAEFAAKPPNYDRFFTRAAVPADAAGRHDYAKEILARFTARAYRRPVDAATIDRLADLAGESAKAPGGSFERGIARAMTAVLASPRFLFRMEETLPEADPQAHPLLDEWALASRLSYFLWSTMPDETLLRLAESGRLREDLPAQIDRMIQDDRSDEFVRNFAGQWLQTRDVESVSIDAGRVAARDAGSETDMEAQYENWKRLGREIDAAEKSGNHAQLAILNAEREEMRRRFRERGKVEFSGSLRYAMRREAEMVFRHLLRSDGSALSIIESDSTFLNEELARHYGIPGVRGGEMRLVKLPAGSPRGGVLTMGAVLAVTSNPTRTSPVKRGLFVLENFLGTPPPPPPPDIPSLEASEKSADGHTLSLRQALALHREQPLCSSCHDRMDPLGLAFENFNAMGAWREAELGQPLETSPGKLLTGEKFADVSELKHILATTRHTDFYRCLTEKSLIYALGRGTEAGDITTIDSIVDSLEASGGKFSTLIRGIVDSAPFQRRQRDPL